MASNYPGPYPSTSKAPASKPVGVTEFEVLKASHKFLREEDARPESWEEKVAEKYYSNLYREFAVCDLKHYKSGNFSLRWRTEEEVLSGSGETTCGNTRCEHHFAQRSLDDDTPVVPLTTLELPFTYAEHGETKSALVKVVLCSACVKKLMYKRTKEKSKSESATPRDKRARTAERNAEAEDGTERRPKKKGIAEEEEVEHRESSRREHRSRKRTREESRSRSRSRERKRDGKSSRRRSASPHSSSKQAKTAR